MRSQRTNTIIIYTKIISNCFLVDAYLLQNNFGVVYFFTNKNICRHLELGLQMTKSLIIKKA